MPVACLQVKGRQHRIPLKSIHQNRYTYHHLLCSKCLSTVRAPQVSVPNLTQLLPLFDIVGLTAQPLLPSGRAGVPMEVMGLMLGEFIDDYTVKVVDVFAMPQSGTGVSVEAVDPVFQTKMLDMLKQTGR